MKSQLQYALSIASLTILTSAYSQENKYSDVELLCEPSYAVGFSYDEKAKAWKPSRTLR